MHETPRHIDSSRKPDLRMEYQPFEVTSLRRPDEGWHYVDPAGHAHQWEWPNGKRVYQPGVTASLPTLEWVRTGTGAYPDGEEYEIGEHRCRQCGAVVQPAYTADRNRVFIPGLVSYTADGVPVSREEAVRLAKLHYGQDMG